MRPRLQGHGIDLSQIAAGQDGRLDLLAGILLGVDDDQLLGAPHNGEHAVVQQAEIPGAQPAVLGERALRLRPVAEIAAGHGRSAYLHPPDHVLVHDGTGIVHDPNRMARRGPVQRNGLVAGGGIGREGHCSAHHRPAFRQPVTQDHRIVEQRGVRRPRRRRSGAPDRAASGAPAKPPAP